MSEMILVATKPNEQIYWVLDSKEPDGVAIRDGNIIYLESFWNYVARGVDPVRVLGGTDFLFDFWKRRTVEETGKFASVYVDKTTPIPDGIYKNIKPFLVDVPKASIKKVDNGADLEMVIDTNKAKKKSTEDLLIEVKAPRSPLKMEPYDPDARDGDNDGIVQENTPWERPAATRLMDAAGNLIERGKESSSRPSGMRVVDADGNDVDYTPTYERSRTGTIGAGRQVGESTSKPKKPEPKKPVADKPTQEKPEVKPKKPGSGSALSDHGAGSLKERGMRDVRSAAAPPPPPEPKKPEPEKPDAPKSKIADNYRQAKVFNGKDWQKTLKDTSDEVKAEVVKRHKRHKENPAARFDDAAEGKDDARLGTLAAHQGFDGKPTVGDSAEEMRDRSGRSGGPEVLFRGVSGLGETPASEFTDQFRNGDLWNGYGMTGGGTYLSKEEQIAISFSGRKRGKSSAVMVMELDPEDIRTATHDDLLEVQRRIDNYIFHEFTKKNRDLSLDEEFLEAVAVDLGMVATFLGYDAMYDGPQQSVVLYNRTAVKVAPNDL